MGLYIGSEMLGTARLVRYVPLKHSTRRTTEPWTASGLETTIRVFAQLYAELLERFPAKDIAQRFQFSFTTNRPVAPKLLETIADIAAGAKRRHPKLSRTLVRWSNLGTAEAAWFFRLFSVDGGGAGLWDQRNLLSQNPAVSSGH
ncbi:hypothetical protein [Microvirga makkahensis]|uniref:Uncharacterized protein n=1 Tax=Microvirga makkahensis TaxID=1128670 RepID=A0A7X3MX49_9HYPH|nr:hypothetical protein [Microvirga makkahensis]MXQ14891.1 hypothetical protein [Microvirga makkahensis]